jgi:hypothetical protein
MLTQSHIDAFERHGRLLARLPKSFTAPHIACPCADIRTWITDYCSNTIIAHMAWMLYTRGGKEYDSCESLVLVIPLDVPDARLVMCPPYTDCACYLLHQPPQDIVLPDLHVDEDADNDDDRYAHYTSLHSADDAAILQQFNVLSVATEEKILEKTFTVPSTTPQQPEELASPVKRAKKSHTSFE